MTFHCYRSVCKCVTVTHWNRSFVPIASFCIHSFYTTECMETIFAVKTIQFSLKFPKICRCLLGIKNEIWSTLTLPSTEPVPIVYSHLDWHRPLRQLRENVWQPPHVFPYKISCTIVRYTLLCTAVEPTVNSPNCPVTELFSISMWVFDSFDNPVEMRQKQERKQTKVWLAISVKWNAVVTNHIPIHSFVHGNHHYGYIQHHFVHFCSWNDEIFFLIIMRRSGYMQIYFESRMPSLSLGPDKVNQQKNK